MILTVTLNPAIDKILILNHFELHKLHRLEEGEMSLVSPGGKGVNIACNLKTIGHEVITTGFAGGHAGHLLCDTLRKMGITTNFIFTPTNTRTNTAILDRKNETLTEINDFGQEISDDDVEFLLENYERLLNRIKLVVIAGSIPVGLNQQIYCRMVEMAKERNIKTILHANSDYTECFMKSSPFMINPDMRSHHMLFGKKTDGIGQFLEAGRYILTHSYDTEFVIFTHRIENVVAVTRERSFIIRPENLKIVNMLGYADAYLSGFIHAWLNGLPIDEVLRFASAAGLSDVEYLNKEIQSLESIEKNLSRIEVEEVE